MKSIFELLNNLNNNKYSSKKFLYFKATKFKYKICQFLKFKSYITKIYWLKIHNKYYLLLIIKKNFSYIKFLKISITYKNIFKLFFKFKGLFIISTSKGLFTISKAYKLKIGGLLICYIL